MVLNRSRWVLKATQVLVACAATLGVTAAWSQATPAGLWKTVDDATGQARSLVRINEAAGVFEATLEKLLDPATPPDKLCDKCPGELHNRPLVGLPILRGVKRAEGVDPPRWDGGTILDPANGKDYKVRLTLVDEGRRLQVRGYIGTPMFGRTQVWVRAE